MLELFTKILATLSGSSPWEILAMVLSILYLVLAARENIWCWPAAFISTAIYIFLFYDATIFLESALNVFYLLMSVYGWYEWKYRKSDKTGRSISTWSWRRHLSVVTCTVAVMLLAGYLFHRYTSSRLPYLDAFTTCFAIVATFMVPWKILENWIYWLIIDTASIYLYVTRGLYVTALLFCIYIVLIVFGYIRWLKEYRAVTGFALRPSGADMEKDKPAPMGHG